MTDKNLIKHRRTLGRLAPQAAAALLLRQANNLVFESRRILAVPAEAVPEAGDVDRLMLAIDDVVARLDGDEGERTFYVVTCPNEVDDG